MAFKEINSGEKLHSAEETEDCVMIDIIMQEFYFSDSAEEVIGGKWVDSYSAADFEDGKYLWRRYVMVLSDGNTNESEPELMGECDVMKQIIPREEHEMKAGDYVWCIEDCGDGDYDYSAYLYMAECLDYVICSAKYYGIDNYSEQLEKMAEECAENDGIEVYIFPKSLCFQSKNEASDARKRLEDES